MTCGFPTEGPFDEAPAIPIPVPRLFLGYYQRFFKYPETSRNRYLAGEMSIPAPGGLSGSPLFRPYAPKW